MPLTGRPYLGEPGQRRSAVEAAVVQVCRALQDVPDPAGADEPDRLIGETEAVTRLRHAVDIAGLESALPGLLTRLRRTLAAVHRAEDRTRLLRAYFWAADSARVTVKDLGHHDLAWIAACHVCEAGEALDDPVWAAAAEFGRSHVLIPAGAARAALAYASAGADAASVMPGPDAVGAHGALQLAAAHAAGVAGLAEEAADRLDAAERLAGGDTGRAFTRGYSFGAPDVALHRMHVAVESGQPQQVLEAVRRMPGEALPTPERRASYWIDLGRAHLVTRWTTPLSGGEDWQAGGAGCLG
jgi:hypothetical protein